jgi:glycosyltransferase involved in cell wall biosynthesis
LTHGGPIADELTAAGIDVRSLGMKSKLDVPAVFRLYRLLREKRVDVLHTYLFHANFLGRIVGRLAGVKVIISSERIMGLEGRYRLVLNRLTSPLADAFTANAQAVKKFMVEEIRLPEEKIAVIYNGVDVGRFDIQVERKMVRDALGLAEGDLACVTVARLDAQKGVRYLIEAARKVVEDKPNVKFLVVGDGPLRGSLEMLSEKLGLTEHVFFLGKKADIARLLKASDVFVLPSVWEGFPNVVLEAMASGLPVIATKTSGTPEAVAEGETGLLVEPKDSDGLAEAILKSLSDLRKLRGMGVCGRKRAEECFSVEKMIRENEKLYVRLTEGKNLT